MRPIGANPILIETSVVCVVDEQLRRSRVRRARLGKRYVSRVLVCLTGSSETGIWTTLR